MISLCCLFVFIDCANIYGTNIYCNNELECTGDIGSSSDDRVDGKGYKSLFQSPSSNTDYRYCFGALSCKETPFIDTNWLSCSGTSSCANIGFIKTTYYIYVGGSNALMNANISIYGTYFSCDGDKSCAHSTISSFGSSILEAYGALSLFRTIINIISGTFDAYFRGYYAGYEATIACKSGTTCNIYCSYNGCGGLSLLCDSNAQCNIIKESDYSLSPNTNIILDTTQILYWNSTEITRRNEEECSTQITDKTFDNNREHSNMLDQYVADIIYTTNVGPICCRASEACIYSLISYNSSSTASVVCSGDSSCYYLDIISNSNDLMVECSALYACEEGSIIGNGGTVYCYGVYSCRQTTITTISNIYCTAYRSCKHAIIRSSGTNINVYLTGYQSGEYASITCNKNDHCRILCDAFQACLNMQLYCYGTCVVECNQDTHCPIEWTANPTINPTKNPIINPTTNPTMNPNNPTSKPTINPTNPTINPTMNSITKQPTNLPTINPTINPTTNPTTNPTNPTINQTMNPITKPPIVTEIKNEADDLLIITRKILIIIICISVFCICICFGFIIFCCYQNKNKKEIEIMDKQLEMEKIKAQKMNGEHLNLGSLSKYVVNLMDNNNNNTQTNIIPYTSSLSTQPPNPNTYNKISHTITGEGQ